MPKTLIGLQFFADGGATGGSAPGSDGASGSGNGLTGDFAADMQRYFGVTPRSAAGNAKKGGSYDGAKGQEAADAGSVTAEGADAEAATSGQQGKQDDDAEFNAFWDKYQKRIQDKIQPSFNERFKRFKETEGNLKAQLAQYEDAAALLRDKYGLAEDAKIEDINERLKTDNTMFSRQAMASGKSTEAYRDAYYQSREQKKADAERKAQQAEAAAQAELQKRQQAVQANLNKLHEEAEELKKTFPQFDLAAEAKNKTFMAGVSGGMSVADAYYAAHHDEIMSGVAAAAAQQSAVKAAQTVAFNRTRPAEGGQNAGTGVRTGVDVSRMTGKDIRDILARVERGERIAL